MISQIVWCETKYFIQNKQVAAVCDEPPAGKYYSASA